MHVRLGVHPRGTTTKLGPWTAAAEPLRASRVGGDMSTPFVEANLLPGGRFGRREPVLVTIIVMAVVHACGMAAGGIVPTLLLGSLVWVGDDIDSARTTRPRV